MGETTSTERARMTLEDLSGEVEYKLASGGIGSAYITSRVRFSRPDDMSYPHSYRSAWNGKVTLSVTQAAIDRGDWWPARGEAEFRWNDPAWLASGA